MSQVNQELIKLELVKQVQNGNSVFIDLMNTVEDRRSTFYRRIFVSSESGLRFEIMKASGSDNYHILFLEENDSDENYIYMNIDKDYDVYGADKFVERISVMEYEIIFSFDRYYAIRDKLNLLVWEKDDEFEMSIRLSRLIYSEMNSFLDELFQFTRGNYRVLIPGKVEGQDLKTLLSLSKTKFKKAYKDKIFKAFTALCGMPSVNQFNSVVEYVFDTIAPYIIRQSDGLEPSK